MNKLGRNALVVAASCTLIVVPAALSANQSGSAAREWTRAYAFETLEWGSDVLGSSGNLRALIGTPASLERSFELKSLLAGMVIDAPGVHFLGVNAPDRESLVVVSMEPLAAMRDARFDAYHVGCWPTDSLAASDSHYAAPQGFVSVTAENAATPVSKRFRLRDFLTHDQQAVWPKVLVLKTALLDKLELIGDELERRGLSGKLHIMSGFRTPQYNAQGEGPNGGRARDSRHMYGDAADTIVDANGDGVMDDLDGDGKVTLADAQVLLAVAETVESQHPELVGGLSAYPANSEHRPYVHIDARGFRARW